MRVRHCLDRGASKHTCIATTYTRLKHSRHGLLQQFCSLLWGAVCLHFHGAGADDFYLLYSLQVTDTVSSIIDTVEYSVITLKVQCKTLQPLPAVYSTTPRVLLDVSTEYCIASNLSDARHMQWMA